MWRRLGGGTRAAFSGLYFTVYAVTDENYRRQLFTAISTELERAIGVQTVYRALTRPAHDPEPAAFAAPT
jgi:hypothetical protein